MAVAQEASTADGLPPARDRKPGMLNGIRIIEVADETAEYAGLLLAGLGADVVKIEAEGFASTRTIGPFYGDEPDPERSLFFWNYNRGKRSVALDLGSAQGRETALELLTGADILLDSSRGRLNEALGLDRQALAARHTRLITARMTPFGDDGPWAGFKGCDLVHLALGGVMMNCGYDPDPSGAYDLPPIAPQMWHAYHIAGEQLVIGILAALIHRQRTGEGQDVACAVHEAVSKNTELDLMSWIMRRAPLHRQTGRHANEIPNRVPNLSYTKDGRWYMTWGVGARDRANLVPFLRRYDMAADLVEPGSDADLHARHIPGSSGVDEQSAHVLEVIQRFIRAYTYDRTPWAEAQAAGLLWSPLRKPHENAVDEHWLMRETFSDIEHPELGRSFRYVTSKWLSSETAWQKGRRAPLRGEHTAEVLEELRGGEWQAQPHPVPARAAAPLLSRRGKPFPLQNVRILDFSWFLASAGGTRFAAALGAESIKVEWKANPDTRIAAQAPVGGRAAREAATAPLPGIDDPDMGGQFNNKNPGKRGLSLNIRHPEGLAIARRLAAICDIVAEGFSPGVLDRLGLGYDALKEIRPDIIYVQQSGMGSSGKYGRLRTVGPIAASFAGISDMSGLPEPAMPAAWGYSYLDWMGAYGFAQAILGALYHRAETGRGQAIDASQCEAGLILCGQSVLDWSASGRTWTRTGNRSVNRSAAPHGAYRCRGEDRWIAIACLTDAHWSSLAAVAGRPNWLGDCRFATLDARLAHEDELDAEVGGWTAAQDAYDCMERLQAAGVPAGVCQTAQDRCERDPQLKALEWLTEIEGTKIGTWPVPEVPFRLSASPGHIGGPTDRGAPCYGEDNAYVLGELLGYSSAEQRRLVEDGVI
jgi:crotonobetainyl-CoA:carnitine CoA-transferase CaiB-like acyl-CoA transferase